VSAIFTSVVRRSLLRVSETGEACLTGKWSIGGLKASNRPSESEPETGAVRTVPQREVLLRHRVRRRAPLRYRVRRLSKAKTSH